MATASVSPDTATGVSEPVDPPSPRAPDPQHTTPPELRRAQERDPPALMAMASVTPSTVTGTVEDVPVPSPS